MTSIVADRLRGSIPITTALITASSRLIPQVTHGAREGTATSSLGKPLLGLSLPKTAPGPRRPKESHTTKRGQPN